MSVFYQKILLQYLKVQNGHCKELTENKIDQLSQSKIYV